MITSIPANLDSAALFLFIPLKSATSMTPSRRPGRFLSRLIPVFKPVPVCRVKRQSYKSIPEVTTRQRDAPSGVVWLCLMFFPYGLETSSAKTGRRNV
jgi:hypothetical protein